MVLESHALSWTWHCVSEVAVPWSAKPETHAQSLHESQAYCGKGAWVTPWDYMIYAMQGHPNRQVIVKSFDKTGGNGNPFQYSCLENPRDSMKRQQDMTLEGKVGRCPVCYYSRGQLLTAPEKWSGWANVEMVLSVDVFGGKNKVWGCKEQYFIGT